VGVLAVIVLGSGFVSATVATGPGAVALSDHTNISSAQPVSDGTYDVDVPGTDSLYYAINLSAKEQVNFTTDGADQAVQLTLIGPDRVTELRSASGGNGFGEEPDATLVYTANQNATFYLEVSTTNDSPTNASLLVSSPDLTDRLEPNDDIEGAASISDGRTTDMDLAGSELDYYAVELNDSEQVTFSTDGASQALQLRVFGPDQVTELRSASGGNGFGDEPDASVTYTANQNGTFYVEVDSINDRSTGYSINLQTPNLTDQLEPNDEFATAPVVDRGRYTDLDLAGAENDYFLVALEADQELSVSLEDVDNNLAATLYSANGTAVVSDDDGGGFFGSPGASFTHTVETGGTYYIGVDSPSNRSSGYTLVVNSNRSIESGNLTPVADAGADRTVNRSDEVILDASGSTDPNRDDLSYTWTQTDGPAVELSGSGATGTFTAPNESADLTFEVTVSDGNLTASDTVTVTVGDDSGFSPGDYDTDGDGSVSGDLQGVLRAIADYNRGEIGLQQALTVIGGYNG